MPMRVIALTAAVLIASPAAAQRDPPPVPHTVNSEVMGQAEDFRIDGPARVCFNRSGVDLLQGETFYLDYLGLHFSRFVIRGAEGDIRLNEGDPFMKDEGGRPVAVPGLSVRRFGAEETLSYVIRARSDFYDGELPIMSVRGLSGAPRDVDFLRRIIIDPDKKSCTKRFLSGWSVDEDEPK